MVRSIVSSNVWSIILIWDYEIATEIILPCIEGLEVCWIIERKNVS